MERKGESLEDLRIRNFVKEFSHLQFNLSSGSSPSPYTCYLISCANSKVGGCRTIEWKWNAECTWNGSSSIEFEDRERQREVRFPVEISGRENGPAAQRVNQWGEDRRTNRGGGE